MAETISIIIPSYNAAQTIARAVISALREPDVIEVFVIDDASTDDTIAQVKSVGDHSNKLKIISLSKNGGPSVARNLALEQCTGSWIAILDSDDFILPGRFHTMLALASKADIIADDIWQVPDGRIGSFRKSLFGESIIAPQRIGFSDFVLSNVTGARERGELGFIKPIMRRSFLDKHQLRYQIGMHLGEDYELYARALAYGARLYLIPERGYVAVMRSESLSGKHTIEDLQKLRDCDEYLGALPGLKDTDRDALRQHYLNTDCRLQWRLMIEAIKQRKWKAVYATLQRPSPVPGYLLTQLGREFMRRFFGRTAGLVVTALASFAFIAIAQKDALLNLWSAWQTEEYSHGIFVVLLAGLLSLQLLKDKKPIVKPSWFGLPLLLFMGLLQCIAYFGAFDTAAEYGFVIAMIGLCLSFTGVAATRTMLPGLAYLLFAVPLPHLFQADLSQKLQLLSSNLGVLPLDWLRIPVYQEGNIIDLGGLKLQVVEACNGLRYLFPLMSFGYLVALLFEGAMWKRVTLFLSTIPIAIGLNALRIALIGVTVDRWGETMAEGFIHGFEGWTVFVLCLLFLLWETLILQHIGTRSRFRSDFLGWPKGALVNKYTKNEGPVFCTLILSALLAGFFCSKQIESIPEIHPFHPPLASFPLQLDAWEGQQDNLPVDVYNSLHVSDYWLANYKTNEENIPVNFYVAYYESQRIGATTHSPSNCIPGGGWQITHSDIKTIALKNGAHIDVTQLLIRRGNEAQLVDYWLQERGRNLTETTIAKWYLLIDSVTTHRTDGALVRVGTPIASSENEADAEQRLNNFLGISYPLLMTFLPSANSR